MRTDMTVAEMARCYEVCDQTLGCRNCGKVWWGEDWTPSLADCHEDGCPLKGRQDVLDVLKTLGPDDLGAMP